MPTVGVNPGFSAVQTYAYDSLNRVKDADEQLLVWTDTNFTSEPTKCWKQKFVYDRYGNRTFDPTLDRIAPIAGAAPYLSIHGRLTG